jgi:predicted O-methyltransferase YrrM
MRLGPRKAGAVLAAGAATAALVLSYLAVGLIGPLLLLGVLQVAAVVALLELRVSLRRHVDSRTSRIRRRVSSLERRLKQRLKGVEERQNALMQRVRQELKAQRERNSEALRDTSEDLAKYVRTTDWHHYKQVEALLALYYDVRPRAAFPPLRSWTASPDLLHYLFRQVLERRPETILELGSGISTVVTAYALDVIGRGVLVSLEHLEEFRDGTAMLLERHGLSHRVDLRLAPLEPVEVDGQSYRWYAIDALPDGPVDLVFVDGPPQNTQVRARYPALPIIHLRLSDGALVILDDYKRADEAQIGERWVERYPHLRFVELHHEKGTAVFEKVREELS